LLEEAARALRLPVADGGVPEIDGGLPEPDGLGSAPLPIAEPDFGLGGVPLAFAEPDFGLGGVPLALAAPCSKPAEGFAAPEMGPEGKVGGDPDGADGSPCMKVSVLTGTKYVIYKGSYRRSST
jgi:hypothetical protein